MPKLSASQLPWDVITKLIQEEIRKSKETPADIEKLINETVETTSITLSADDLKALKDGKLVSCNFDIADEFGPVPLQIKLEEQ